MFRDNAECFDEARSDWRRLHAPILEDSPRQGKI